MANERNDLYGIQGAAALKRKKEIREAFISGRQEMENEQLLEQVAFDSSWILKIKSYLKNIENITSNPRFYIEEIHEIVNVEKVKRVSARSIQHLSSHMNLVREVKEDGKVVPKKLLTITYEDSTYIYENRFVMTLIAKLAKFIEERYRVIVRNLQSYQYNRMKVKSNFRFEEKLITCEVRMNIREKLEDEIYRKNMELLDELKFLRDQSRALLGSGFYKQMTKVAKPITPPIQKTNIIMKSVDYSACLRLWQFLDSYNQMGIKPKLYSKETPVNGFGTQIADIVSDCVFDYERLLVNNLEYYDRIKYRERKVNSSKNYSENLFDSMEDDPLVLANDFEVDEYGLQKVQNKIREHYGKLMKLTLSSDDFTDTVRQFLSVENDILSDLIQNRLEQQTSEPEKSMDKINASKKEKQLLHVIIQEKQKELKKLVAKETSLDLKLARKNGAGKTGKNVDEKSKASVSQPSEKGDLQK